MVRIGRLVMCAAFALGVVLEAFFLPPPRAAAGNEGGCTALNPPLCSPGICPGAQNCETVTTQMPSGPVKRCGCM